MAKMKATTKTKETTATTKTRAKETTATTKTKVAGALGLLAVGAIGTVVRQAWNDSTDRRICKVAGHVRDRLGNPYFGANVVAQDKEGRSAVDIQTKEDGEFSQQLACADLHDQPIFVSLSRGYCFVQSNDKVNAFSKDGTQFEIFIDLPEVPGSGPCPRQ